MDQLNGPGPFKLYKYKKTSYKAGFFSPNKPVSRILFFRLEEMIIYLGQTLLNGSSSLLEKKSRFRIAPGRVYHKLLSPAVESCSIDLKGYPIFNSTPHDTFHLSPPKADSIVSVALVLTKYCYLVGGCYPLP